MSASDTPKSRLDTSSFPPVSTPPPALALKLPSNRSCCHLSGSCLGCGGSQESHAHYWFIQPTPRSCLFCLIISSKDISILSAMAMLLKLKLDTNHTNLIAVYKEMASKRAILGIQKRIMAKAVILLWRT
uniref:Uncharacterized protein n=1 Tax=Paramormyrops kingsleyae TaxID=1676925 RepID=A0A3B3RYD8_9TELE